MLLIAQRLYCGLYEAAIEVRPGVMPDERPFEGKRRWRGSPVTVVDFPRLLEYRKGFTVRSSSIGQLQITPHALERYAQRLRKTTRSAKEKERPFWSLFRFLTHAVFRPAVITREDVLQHKLEKYGRLFSVTKYWKANVKELYLVTIPHPTIPKLNILVTIFYRPDRDRGIKVKGGF